MFSNNLKKAVLDKKIGKPAIHSSPEDFPFSIALSAVSNINGCKPAQNQMGLRVAAGCDDDAARACFLAAAEAVERYSIQFSPSKKQVVSSIYSTTGTSLDRELGYLTIGAPDPYPVLSSIGSASGATIESAAIRAVLETLEHAHIDLARQGKEEFKAVDAAEFPLVEPMQIWLDTQLRKLSFQLFQSKKGYCVCVCSCSDFDGGRKTVGSAAALTPQTASRKAAQESIFFYRNMVNLESNGVSKQSITGNELIALSQYRGAIPHPTWLRDPSLPIPPFVQQYNSKADFVALLQAASDTLDKQIYVYDMSDPNIKIPVVRVIAI